MKAVIENFFGDDTIRKHNPPDKGCAVFVFAVVDDSFRGAGTSGEVLKC